MGAAWRQKKAINGVPGAKRYYAFPVAKSAAFGKIHHEEHQTIAF